MARTGAWIHTGRKIRLSYADELAGPSDRIVWPVTIAYFQTVRLLVAWCELRQDFRHFRADRVTAADFLDERYPDRPAILRDRWLRGMEAHIQRRQAEGAAGPPLRADGPAG
ncbi:YafY family protein [Azospirillum sp. B4]|uniref:helix-turn-helix transcriptional regulator n=1 Tax=Azospirillum sp. B4 TaxID=95605 RepID=UPI0019025013|nr:WYL domain-containing protein [Azospirillum sp. B4]